MSALDFRPLSRVRRSHWLGWLLTGVATVQCSSSLPPEVVVDPPVIQQVRPYGGAPGAAIVIEGAGLTAAGIDTKVHFGSVEATVIEKSNEMLNVLVPVDVVSGNALPAVFGAVDLRVSVGGQESKSSPFIVHAPAPAALGALDRSLMFTDLPGHLVSPDGLAVAAVQPDDTIWQLGLEDERASHQLLALDASPVALAWHPDGGLFAGSTTAGMVRIVTAATGAPVSTFTASSGHVPLAWNPQVDLLLMGVDGGFKMWFGGGITTTIISTVHRVSAVGWSDDGAWFALGTLSGVVLIFNVADVAPVWTDALSAGGQPIEQIEWSHDSTVMAARSDAPSLVIFERDGANWSTRRILSGSDLDRWLGKRFAWHPQEFKVVTAGSKELRAWTFDPDAADLEDDPLWIRPTPAGDAGALQWLADGPGEESIFTDRWRFDAVDGTRSAAHFWHTTAVVDVDWKTFDGDKPGSGAAATLEQDLAAVDQRGAVLTWQVGQELAAGRASWSDVGPAGGSTFDAISMLADGTVAAASSTSVVLFAGEGEALLAGGQQKPLSGGLRFTDYRTVTGPLATAGGMPDRWGDYLTWVAGEAAVKLAHTSGGEEAVELSEDSGSSVLDSAYSAAPTGFAILHPGVVRAAVADGAALAEWSVEVADSATRLLWSRDRRQLVAAGYDSTEDRTLFEFLLATGGGVLLETAVPGQMIDLDWRGDGAYLAVLLTDGTVRMIDCFNGGTALLSDTGVSGPRAIAWQDDGPLVAIAGRRGVVVYEVE